MLRAEISSVRHFAPQRSHLRILFTVPNWVRRVSITVLSPPHEHFTIEAMFLYLVARAAKVNIHWRLYYILLASITVFEVLAESAVEEVHLRKVSRANRLGRQSPYPVSKLG